MKVRAGLRSATASDHERVDALFSRFDLVDPAQYRLFLIAQAAAHIPVEHALDKVGAEAVLPDWPSRRRSHLLMEDLAALGAEPPPPLEPPLLAGASEIFGAIYVLEGSRLGGAFLNRSLLAGTPNRFLSAEQAPGAWRKLLAKLEESLYEPARVEEASDTARQVFELFEAAARRQLEP